ncbi:MAG: hypothetical protein ACYTAF_05020 [Planctomycetota bacterium]
MDRFQEIRAELEKALVAASAPTSMLERLAVLPWESPDAGVRAAWEKLTDPRNLELLERALRMPLNDREREICERALEECRRKGES